MTKSTAKYLVLLAVVSILFDWKVFLTHQFTLLAGGETVSYTYSWLHFWIRSLWAGHLPLWDPYGFCGRPFAVEMLPSTFYPLHLLLLLFPFNRSGFFSPALYHDIFVVSRWLCLCFTFALIRELRLSRFSAFIGACCFSLTGLVGGMIWPPFVEAAGWLPIIFLFLLRALRAPETGKAAREAALCGLCLGMSILTGGLHFSIMQGMFVLIAIAYYGSSTAPAGGLSAKAHWQRMFLILGIFLVVSGGAGAVQMLPEFEYAKLSLRFIDGGAFPSSEKIPYHRLNTGMWPQSILTVLFPFAYGRVSGGEAWGSYIGAFPFFLAMVAVWKNRQHLWVRFMGGMAVLAYVYTLAEFSPLHGWLYALVPYIWSVREAGRFVYLVCFALAILAAFGTESLLDSNFQQDTWKRAREVVKWVAITCGMALFVPAVFTQLTIGIWTAFSLVLVLASCGWFYYLTSHPAGPAARFLLAAFVLFDLTAFHLTAVNKWGPDHPDEQFNQLVSLQGAANFVKKQTEPGRARLSVSPEPNFGDLYGVQTFWGGGGTALISYSVLSGTRPELLNIRYTIKPASTPNPGSIYQDAAWKVYIEPSAYPRAWIVHQTETEPSQEAAFQRLKDPAVDFHRVALLETQLPQSLEQAGNTGEQVRFTSYEANRMALDVSTAGRSLLVLSEMHYPAWQATVNGKPTEILRVDGGLRGIVVPSGKSQVELRYVPIRIYVGGILSLLTFAGVLTAVTLAWRLERATPVKSEEPKTVLA